MIKSWKQTIEDINAEIEHIRIILSGMQFNSEFGAELHKVKIRIAELEDRLHHSTKLQKSEAAAMRAMIDEQMADYRREVIETKLRLKDLRLLRHERAHENFLHIQALKACEEQEGGAE